MLALSTYSRMFSMLCRVGPQSTRSRVAPRYPLSCARSPRGGNGGSRSRNLPREANSSNCSSQRLSSGLSLIEEPCRKLDDPSKTTRDGESAEELTKIFLSCLHTHFISILEKRLGPSIVRSTPMDFVVTVPAIWSHAAKQTTERAAAMAGFCGSKRIQLISEPVCS